MIIVISAPVTLFGTDRFGWALFGIKLMAGKRELEEQQVRRENPAFAKLIDVLNNSLLQDGKPRETASRLKQVMG